eukprot:Hpha_TRINITY_DN33917_c0_g1::TRINITY_DN33917_c0_g1_i1::g.69320::m.69320
MVGKTLAHSSFVSVDMQTACNVLWAASNLRHPDPGDGGMGRAGALALRRVQVIAGGVGAVPKELTAALCAMVWLRKGTAAREMVRVAARAEPMTGAAAVQVLWAMGSLRIREEDTTCRLWALVGSPEGGSLLTPQSLALGLWAAARIQAKS